MKRFYSLSIIGLLLLLLGVSSGYAYQVINMIDNCSFELCLSNNDIPYGWRFYTNEGSTFTWGNSPLSNIKNVYCNRTSASGDTNLLGRYMEGLIWMWDDEIRLTWGTPLPWLENGKKIEVADVPTYYGPMSFSIVSAIDTGVINAIVEPPERNSYGSIKLRLRHPKKAKLTKVTVNGKPWLNFGGEIITLPSSLKGRLEIKAYY